MNVDEDGRAAAAHHIQGIPAFVLFHGGREVARRAGLASRRDLEAWIARSVPATPYPPARPGAGLTWCTFGSTQDASVATGPSWEGDARAVTIPGLV